MDLSISNLKELEYLPLPFLNSLVKLKEDFP